MICIHHSLTLSQYIMRLELDSGSFKHHSRTNDKRSGCDTKSILASLNLLLNYRFNLK